MFYLLTMCTPDAARLAVPEAERRLRFFVQSLYMHQLPKARGGVLAMPSFNVVTPVYAETVIFDLQYLSAPSPEGTTPMAYLTTMYAPEWANFLERLGVTSESAARAAQHDSAGEPVSGEMELRLWASLRGQTLARAVAGVTQYGAGIRLLAWLQLELEYAALDAALPPPDGECDAAATAAGGGAGPPPPPPPPPRASDALLEDAAAASAWFTTERFAFVVAAQKYADHGRDDLAKRAQLDYLLLTHPLLKLVHFEGGVSAATGARQVYSVCRDGRGVLARLVIPGNPIADGIGEGKVRMGETRERDLDCMHPGGLDRAKRPPPASPPAPPPRPPSTPSPRTRTTARPSCTRESNRRWT